MTATSSLSFRITTRGDSWISSVFDERIGWPTNSGLSCISMCSPKKPRPIANQLSSPAPMSPLVDDESDVGACEPPMGEAFVVMVLVRWVDPVRAVRVESSRN